MRRIEALYGNFFPIRENTRQRGDVFVAPQTPHSRHDVFRGKPPENPNGSPFPDKKLIYHHPLYTHNREEETVTVGGQVHKIMPMLSRALTVFERRANRLTTHNELLQETFRDRYPKQIVYRLRKVIEPDPKKPVVIIRTAEGYVFVDPTKPDEKRIYVHQGIGSSPGYIHDVERGTVEVNGVKQSLTPTENKLLSLLEERPNRLVTHVVILQRVWGLPGVIDASTRRLAKTHITHLQSKIEPLREESEPVLLTSIRGLGYRLNDPSRTNEAEQQEWKYKHEAWTHFPERKIAVVDGKPISLGFIENQILQILEETPNKVVSVDAIDDRLREVGIDRSVDISTGLSHLRDKIEPQRVKRKFSHIECIAAHLGWILHDPSVPDYEPE